LENFSTGSIGFSLFEPDEEKQMNKISQMIGDITVIIRIAFRQTGLTDEQRLRNTLISLILPLGALFFYQLLFCWVKNTFGWDLTWTTVILSLVVVFFVVRALFNLRRLLSLGIIGEGLEVLGLAPAEYPTSRLFLAYWNLATAILFWELAISFLLPRIDLTQNPLIGISLLLCAVIYTIVYPEGDKIKKATCWGIVLITALMVMELIFTPAVCAKLVGGDPFGAMRTSSADRALAEVLATQEEIKDSRTAARLKVIQKKIKRGGILTPEEKKLLKEQNRGLLQKAIGTLGSSEKSDGNVYAKIDPLLDIDMSSSKKADASGDDIVVAQGGHATFKLFVEKPPIGTAIKPIEMLITLNPSGSKYLYYTFNGKRYEAFLDSFGRKRIGLTSDMIIDINTLVLAGDNDLIINGKDAITVAKMF
jgi:hypothetical protein